MLYIQRDNEGNITGLSLENTEGAEEATLSDPDVRNFLSTSDLDLIRVLEDLIDVLVQKNVFSITDLPESAQLKLLYRKNTRSMLDDSPSLLVEDEKLL